MISAPRQLELLHWNDVHGAYDGLARLSHRARQVRAAAHHPVLLLDGGDVEESSVRLSAMTFGVSGWRLLGAAGVDAAVAGNGGLLRYGPGLLPRYADALGSPPLVCDLEQDGRTPAGAEPSRIVEAGDVRVGIVGITDYYPQYDDFGLTERGRVTAVRREALALRDAGAEVVVVLSHAGLNHDRGLSWSLRGLVDVVVGGHSHHLLVDGDREQGLPIAQAGWRARHLGRVLLALDDDGVRVVDMSVEEIDDDAPQDRAVLAEWEAAERDLAAWLAEPVAHLPQAAPDAPPGRDSAATRLLLDALLHHEPADVGLLMGLHVGAGLPGGVVTRGDVWETTSSPGNLTTATLTGAELRHVVARGRSAAFAEHRSRAGRGEPFGLLHTVGVEDPDALRADHRYRVTASDIELSSYGTLVDSVPGDLDVHVPRILPELLEDYLRERYPLPAPR